MLAVAKAQPKAQSTGRRCVAPLCTVCALWLFLAAHQTGRAAKKLVTGSGIVDEMLSTLHNALGALDVGSREEPQSTDGVDPESGWLVDVDMELEAAQRGLKTRFVCPQKGRHYEEQAQAVPISDGVFLPVLASRPPGASIDLAVVAMHGKPRDYEDYFRKTLVAINEQPGCGAFQSSCRILSIVPVFPDEPCTAHAWSGGSSKVEAPIWSTDGKVQQWAYGGFSDPGSSSNGTGLGGIPSFAAFDAVLEWVTTAYPTVRAIVASGYSAGGQMIQRWSVLSAEGANGVTRLGVPLRIVVGAPSSVLYLDSTRPAQSCSPEKNTGPHHVCTSFSVPKEKCNGYDEYGHGLGNIQGSWASAHGLVTSGASTYLFSSLSSAGKWQSALLDRLATKNIRYFVGELDTQSCIVGACDGSCASMLTGSNRLQRLQNFVSYLEQVFGPGKPQHLSLIPGQGHRQGILHVMQMELPEWVAWSVEAADTYNNAASSGWEGITGRVKQLLSIKEKEDIDAVAGKVDAVEGKVDAVEGKVDVVEQKIKSVEGKVDTLIEAMSRIESMLVNESS